MGYMKSAPLKIVVVVVGAITLSTISIFAADSIRGVDSNLAQLIGSRTQNACPQGMSLVSGGDFRICVDTYEASPSASCPQQVLRNTLESESNIGTAGCTPVSVKDAEPWTYISLTQAQRACAAAGKRLPVPSEWYRFVLGSETKTCVVDASQAQKTGTSDCVSESGIYDGVGNVWEWVDAQVTNNMYDGRVLPETGYVASVDVHGIALTSTSTPEQLYGADYFWSKTDGVFGMIRGGYYGSGKDAGLYTLNASVPTNFAAQGVGFRCVVDAL